MSHLKSIATSLFGTAILLTAVTGPVLAAPAQPTTPAKTAAPVAPVKSPQAQGVAITPKTISSKTAEYEATITIPVISGLKDKAYEAQLNAQLLKQAQDALKNTQTMSKEDAADAKKYGWDLRPHALDISYKAVSTGKLVSFSVQTYVYTIANLDTAKNLQLSDLFQPGYDYRYVINHIIKQQIQADNTNLYDFESISDNQSFSFDKGNLVIHFGQYEIAAYAAGMPSFTIPARSFHNLLKPEIRALLQ
jgi:cytochrome bd-type quinol oxidase subunit 1